MAKASQQTLYLGVDVGGTKILAALVEPSGAIVARARRPTPRKGTAERALAEITAAMEEALAEAGAKARGLAAVGLAIPGVVDPDAGLVVVTPNMNLTGLVIVPPVEERFGVPVALGNDVNLGTLGEHWLGAARGASSAVGIMVGTGIGGGVIVDGKLVRGAREGGGEIGHIVVQPGGPKCGCGNRGCLEALASRSAIERDIRKAIAKGKKSVLAKKLGKKRAPIKSGTLRRALDANDPVVTKVMRKAAQILGYGCLTVRHLLDPEVIVLGGGVMEACGEFVLPIVRKIVEGDRLAGARPGGEVVESELGDDAVVLGAAALAQQAVGRTPPRPKARPAPGPPGDIPDYPTIQYATFGQVTVGGKVHDGDVYVRADGSVRKRKKKLAKQRYGTSHQIGPEELEKVCKGDPALLVIGAGQGGAAELTAEGEQFLRERGIEVVALPTPKAAEAFNRATGRKAALVHVTC